MKFCRVCFLTVAVLLMTCLTWGQKRKIIIDEDAAGPAGTAQQSILLLIQSPQTEVLGITVVTGDQWLKAEVAHTLRMLAHARTHRTNRHSGRARSGVPPGSAKTGNGTLGAT